MTTLPDPETDPAGYLGGVARLMRERAEAATPGPWSAANEHELLGPDAGPAWCVSRMRPGYESMGEEEGYLYDVAETSLGGRRESDGPDAEHIASWHPAVALAVADGLDGAAAMIREADGGPLAILAAGVTTHWLAVARAYVGSQP